MTKHSVGIIVDNTSSSKQTYDFIELSRGSKNYEVTHLIINNTSPYTGSTISKSIQYIRRRGAKKFISNAAFKVLCNLESIIVKRSHKFSTFFDRLDLAEFDLKVIKVNPVISKSGLLYRYNEEDIDKIKSLNLNLLVRAGGGIMRGDILTVCKNGVISFHHADNDVNRGGPPGFWETKNKEPRTGFVIQRLKDELDGGDVLFKGFVPTSWMYTLTLTKLFEISNSFLHYVIEDVTSEFPRLSVHHKKPYSFPLYTTPTLSEQTSYVLATMAMVVEKLYRKILGKSYRWGVAYQFVDEWRDVTLWRSKRIPNPPNRFLADPFVIKKNGNNFVFVEDYDYKTTRGCISVYSVSEDGWRELGVALEEDFHLSYPFLFEYECNLYMCPETNEANDIRLYKCVEFPLKWEFDRTLIKDISAADTNIFFRDGKWWLMSNISTSHIGDHGSQLHIFCSDDPLSNNWHPHRKNPVIFDPLTARNGGFISGKDGQYRVFQRQGFDLYGEALGVSKIVTLTENEYEETCDFEVEANFFEAAKGTHTYNYCDGLLVFDFVEISTHRNPN